MNKLFRLIARSEVKAAMRLAAFAWWWADHAIHRAGEKSEDFGNKPSAGDA